MELNILELNTDVLHVILKNLDIKSIVRLSQTCRQFYEFIDSYDDPTIKHRLCILNKVHRKVNLPREAWPPAVGWAYLLRAAGCYGYMDIAKICLLGRYWRWTLGWMQTGHYVHYQTWRSLILCAAKHKQAQVAELLAAMAPDGVWLQGFAYKCAQRTIERGDIQMARDIRSRDRPILGGAIPRVWVWSHQLELHCASAFAGVYMGPDHLTNSDAICVVRHAARGGHIHVIEAISGFQRCILHAIYYGAYYGHVHIVEWAMRRCDDIQDLPAHTLNTKQITPRGLNKSQPLACVVRTAALGAIRGNRGDVLHMLHPFIEMWQDDLPYLMADAMQLGCGWSLLWLMHLFHDSEPFDKLMAYNRNQIYCMRNGLHFYHVQQSFMNNRGRYSRVRKWTYPRLDVSDLVSRRYNFYR